MLDQELKNYILKAVEEPIIEINKRKKQELD